MNPYCPHCKDELQIKKGIPLCTKHGVLPRVVELKERTSKKFSQVLWTEWFKFTGQHGVTCPDCFCRMIILNPETNKTLQIDCCPNCYAIWLDKGESKELNFAFLAFESKDKMAEKAKSLAEAQDQMACSILEHEKATWVNFNRNRSVFKISRKKQRE